MFPSLLKGPAILNLISTQLFNELDMKKYGQDWATGDIIGPPADLSRYWVPSRQPQTNQTQQPATQPGQASSTGIPALNIFDAFTTHPLIYHFKGTPRSMYGADLGEISVQNDKLHFQNPQIQAALRNILQQYYGQLYDLRTGGRGNPQERNMFILSQMNKIGNQLIEQAKLKPHERRGIHYLYTHGGKQHYLFMLYPYINAQGKPAWAILVPTKQFPNYITPRPIEEQFPRQRQAAASSSSSSQFQIQTPPEAPPAWPQFSLPPLPPAPPPVPYPPKIPASP